MATVTLASPSINTKLSHAATFTLETKSNTRRDDSFSSYLNLIRENLAQDLSDSTLTPATMRITLGKKRAEDGEIGIFGAEKYFSGAMDDEAKTLSERSGKSSCRKEAKMSFKSRSVTESSCSETSANSRNSLLRGRRKRSLSFSGRKQAITGGNKFLGVFPCSCSGKEATKVEKDASDSDVGSRNCKKVGHFEDKEETAGEKMNRMFIEWKKEDTLGLIHPNQMPLKSSIGTVGPFGSPFVDKGAISSNRRKVLNLPAAIGGDSGDIARDGNDDLMSESSSDLFEIDSLSINGHGHHTFEPEPAYEPSEASIEWSVATASVANVSVATDVTERRSGEMKKTAKNHKSGILLGCASQKAVDAATHVYKKPQKVSSGRLDQYGGLENLPPVARYHASQSVYTR